MNDAIEAARRFNEVMGPLMLWGVNHWQIVAAGVLILSVAMALATKSQQISDRKNLAREIARGIRDA